jgi:CRP-like cAMP-binding protein
MNDHVEIRQHPNPKAWLIRYNESGVVYRLQYWQNRLGALAEYELRSQIYEQIWYALTRIGQIPPYPGLAIRDGNLLDDQGNEALSDRERIMILTKNELFKTLTAAQLQTLAKATRQLRFAPLEAVVRQGESGESLYLVAEGRLVATRTTEEGKTNTIHTFGEGEIFGEMAVFTGSARTATIQCLEEALLLEVGRPALLSLMQEDHLLLEHLSDLVTQREKELDQLNSESNASDGHQEMRSKIKQLFEKLLKGLH